MKPQTPPSELSLALDTIRPAIVRAALFSMIISLLALAPTVYMLEVYDRVVNSRSGMTLAMLTLMIVGALCRDGNFGKSARCIAEGCRRGLG
jgi:ATP-binding cassette, subfamily C, bacterial exporter for protease/lipase